jgi:hypothetical protein
LHPEKSLITSYLGKFIVELDGVGIFHTQGNNNLEFYIETITGFPSLGVNLKWHGIFVLLFSIVVAGVTLFFNYKFYRLFEVLKNSISNGTPFSTDVSDILKTIWKVSLLIFLAGSVLSIIKILVIDDVVFDSFVARPVFDNQLLNFLWFGLGIYVLNEIYKVGIELKNEQDLTI